MKIVLSTERLYLREFTMNDAQLLIDLNSNPEVIRYTGDGHVENIVAAEKIISDIILPQYKNKIGRWAVHLKSNDEFIGWCGLKFISEDNQIDLGYRFFQQHWRKGYATESAKAAMDYGINVMQLKNIIAKAAKDNIASIHVIKKLGMVYLKDDLCGHDPAEVYILK
jgi:ribosomal-protein-alanine N-acetyltransferase